MKINGVELAKAPHYRIGEPIVTISTYPSSHEQVVWPLTGATIDALCAELRRIVRGAEELTLVGKLFRISRHGREMNFNIFGTNNPEWIRGLRDMCNAALESGDEKQR